MKKRDFISSDTFNGIYFLYISTLVGKLTKKGKKFKAIKYFKRLKENIKLNTNKKRKVSFIFLLSVLNSMPKVSFKEIRMGSQKKDIPKPISEEKQVLVSIETLLKLCKRNKTLEFDRLTECIISSYQNKGILVKNKRLKYRKAIINKMLLNMFNPKKQMWKKKKYASEKINYEIYKNKASL